MNAEFDAMPLFLWSILLFIALLMTGIRLFRRHHGTRVFRLTDVAYLVEMAVMVAVMGTAFWISQKTGPEWLYKLALGGVVTLALVPIAIILSAWIAIRAREEAAAETGTSANADRHWGTQIALAANKQVERLGFSVFMVPLLVVPPKELSLLQMMAFGLVGMIAIPFCCNWLEKRLQQKLPENVPRGQHQEPVQVDAAEAARVAGATAPWGPQIRLITISLALCAPLTAPVLAMLRPTPPFGLSLQVAALICLLWMTIPLFLIAFASWPGRVTRKHTVFIAARPQAVWETLHYRETDAYYRPSVARLTQISSAPVAWRMHMRDVGPCWRCGLPKGADRIAAVLRIDLLQLEPGHLQHTRCTAESVTGMPSLYRAEESIFEVSPHARGSEVSYTCIIDRPRLFTVLMGLANVAPKDLLQDLAETLEGRPGKSLYAVGRKSLLDARAAKDVCGCEHAAHRRQLTGARA